MQQSPVRGPGEKDLPRAVRWRSVPEGVTTAFSLAAAPNLSAEVLVRRFLLHIADCIAAPLVPPLLQSPGSGP